jgi:hypothetical protein
MITKAFKNKITVSHKTYAQPDRILSHWNISSEQAYMFMNTSIVHNV